MTDRVNPDDVALQEAVLGYSILVRGEHAGSIEGVPGRLEYIEMAAHWEGQGIAQAAIREFVELSRRHGETVVTTNNTTHPAAKHLLETEGFEPQDDDMGGRRNSQLGTGND